MSNWRNPKYDLALKRDRVLKFAIILSFAILILAFKYLLKVEAKNETIIHVFPDPDFRCFPPALFFYPPSDTYIPTAAEDNAPYLDLEFISTELEINS